MRRYWASSLATISGGVGLLVLLAAQEKLCPWLSAPLESAQISVDARCSCGDSDGLPDSAPTAPKKQPLTLVGALPDAMTGRGHVAAGGISANILGDQISRSVARARPNPLDRVADLPVVTADWRSLCNVREIGPLAIAAERGPASPVAVVLVASIKRTGPPLA